MSNKTLYDLRWTCREKIIADFKEIGYKKDVTTLCAADHYTPQKPEHVIFIGNRIGLINIYSKPMLSPNEYKSGDGRPNENLLKNVYFCPPPAI